MFAKEKLHDGGVNYVRALKWSEDGNVARYKVTINGLLYAGADTAYEANVIAYSACIMLQTFGYKTRISFHV